MRKGLFFIMRVVVVFGLLGFAFYFAELSIYHAWANGFHNLPDRLREWHDYWAEVFSNLALFSFFVFVAYCAVNLIRLWRARS